jgi:hypothetical protein
VAAAADEEELRPKVRDARARIAFYASTPSYRAAFEHLGLGDLADEAKLLSRAQRWEELPALISEEVLDQFAVIGTYDRIGRTLVDRFAPVVTDSEFSIPVRDERERETLAGLVKEIRSAETDTARSNIVGDGA